VVLWSGHVKVTIVEPGINSMAMKFDLLRRSADYFINKGFYKFGDPQYLKNQSNGFRAGQRYSVS
jgi:hypothetical protein